MRLPIGISDFKELITGGYVFADKSLFVKEVIEDGAKVILITRPRRFGKTLNLSMLSYFLGNNQESGDKENLFAGLNISKDVAFCQKHQHQYPIIFMTFKGIKHNNYEEAYDNIIKLISLLYSEHRYLLEGDLLHEDEKNLYRAMLNKQADLADIQDGIRQLAVYLERKFKKSPIILIDEYDTPIQEAYIKGYYREMVELMRNILGETLKDNKYISKAVLTGITKVSQESLFSGLNNISVYTVLREKYGQYFGFSETEVLNLLKASKQEIPMSTIKEWYNGYQIGKYVLYNPWSIMSCLDNNGALKPYWLNTASNELIAKLLSNAKPEVKQQLEELLQGKEIEQPLFENLVFLDIKNREEALWSLLLYAGYLKVLSTELGDYQLRARLMIPNKEVGFVYNEIIAGWFGVVKGMDSYTRFVESLAKGDVKEFKNYLASYIMQTGSYFDFNKNTAEQIFHIFILGLVVGLRDHYYIYSNQESGLGRFDVIFIPKNKEERGILLEFKTSDRSENLKAKAEEALEQIKDKKYIETFKKEGIGSVLAIGLAFCGKEVEAGDEIIDCWV